MASSDKPGDQDLNSILASIRRIVVDEPIATPALDATPLELDESLLDPGPESLEAPLVPAVLAPQPAVAPSPAHPGDPTTLEAVVRAALEPMLRQWLDANLSRLVTEALDKATQAEITRLTRR